MTKNFPYLTHPIVLTALALTAVNDHYLKYAYPNFLTGKISDFAGLFFFPLLLYGLYEFAKSPLNQHTKISKKQLIIFMILSDVLFILCKYTALKHYLVTFLNVRITSDYTDLIALSVNIATYDFAKKYFNEGI